MAQQQQEQQHPIQIRPTVKPRSACRSFATHVPEARSFSYLVQSLPVLKITSLYEHKKLPHELNKCDVILSPAAMIAFSRALNIILARVIMNSIFVYDASSTLRTIDRNICLEKEKLLEMDPYFNTSTNATRWYPLAKEMLYSLKFEHGCVASRPSSTSKDFFQAEESDKLKCRILRDYAFKLISGSCASLCSRKYSKSLTTVHIAEGERLMKCSCDPNRVSREKSLISSQFSPHSISLTTEQMDTHQLVLNPFINWVQTAIYNLPYKYETIRFIRKRLLEDLWKNNWLERVTSHADLNIDLVIALDFCNEKPRFGELENTILTDGIDKGAYYVMEYWIKMAFFCHVTDFGVYYDHQNKPSSESKKAQEHSVNAPYHMHPIPYSIDGVSPSAVEAVLIKKLASHGVQTAAPLHMHRNKENTHVPYFGESIK